MSGKQTSINLIKSLIDYNSTTGWGRALRYAVAEIEKNVEEDKFTLWSIKVKEYQSKRFLRKGQSWMIALADVDDALYKEITGTRWDCFHDNTVCYVFMDKLIEVWGK
jgi:hypothetical protein